MKIWTTAVFTLIAGCAAAFIITPRTRPTSKDEQIPSVLDAGRESKRWKARDIFVRLLNRKTTLEDACDMIAGIYRTDEGMAIALDSMPGESDQQKAAGVVLSWASEIAVRPVDGEDGHLHGITKVRLPELLADYHRLVGQPYADPRQGGQVK